MSPTRKALRLLSLVIAALVWACAGRGSEDPPEARLVSAPREGDQEESRAAHEELLRRERFPSAQACRNCHPEHFRQWSASPHAYAQLSPVFNAMHATILLRTNGSSGDFCIRCHTPVGMALGEPLVAANADRDPVALEGVTCIVCHRMDEALGKVSGRRPLIEAPLVEPIIGPSGNEELKRVIDSPDYRVETDDDGQGRQIHGDVRRLPQLTESGFCASCHDVNLPNGLRLEEAFSEYKTSAAAARGESCQDCHMGEEPGLAAGYPHGPAAIVGGKPTRDRRITRHDFAGPDYPVVHPGIFPHDPRAQKLATMAEWLQFDWEAGWGRDDFEDEVGDDAIFPDRWSSADDRYDAREVLDRQEELLAEIESRRLALLRRGYVLDPIEVAEASLAGLRFGARVRNGTDGHSAPTGFVAERMVFVQVELRDPAGRVVFRSGDLDPNGDLRDRHSLYVHAGELEEDEQLFNLQSKFITTNVRGGEREQVLAINFSVDALPFVRPERFPSTLTGRPNGARIHKYGIEPLGSRRADYEVDADLLTGPGEYRVTMRLIAGMVPPNLIAAISEVGFDYGLSARELARRVVAGHQVLWEREVVIDVR
ncbi:MAG: cytochrome C [Planctomycetes bacterium]|nr:cytochrome C [Planctomycetota bacterium]